MKFLKLTTIDDVPLRINYDFIIAYAPCVVDGVEATAIRLIDFETYNVKETCKVIDNCLNVCKIDWGIPDDYSMD